MEASFSKSTDVSVVNYHPDHSETPGNIFKILKDGRYTLGKGKYYVIEQQGELVCSAGWNEYDFDPTIALVLTRMYVNPKYRAQYYAATYILPKILAETHKYPKVWATMNEYNLGLYRWFERRAQGKRTTLFNDWPDIYENFRPIGKRDIYSTEQYIIEFNKEKI
jgi:hypothetical protein